MKWIQASTLSYKVGDVTQPEQRPCIIVHCCNDIGAFGGGVSGAIGKAFPIVQERYHEWDERCEEAQELLPGGKTETIPVADGLWVCNLIGQHGVRSQKNPNPVVYEWIASGFREVRSFIHETESGFSEAEANRIKVALPRLGCGLAGGDWAVIEAIVIRELVLHGIDVFVYDREQDVATWESRYPREYLEIDVMRQAWHER